MTPEEYAHGVIAKANAGMFDPSSGMGLYNAIVKAIAAAVQAEREACAKVAEELRDYTPEEYDREAHKWLTRTAAAIRARGNGRERR